MERDKKLFELSPWVRRALLLITLATLLVACGRDTGVTSVVLPTVIQATATESGEMSQLLPEAELPVEADPEVLRIQELCREYMLEPDADLCLGRTVVNGRGVWSGVAGSDYGPGTVVTLYGYESSGTSHTIFEQAYVAYDETLVATELKYTEDSWALVAEIGGLGDKALTTSIVPPERNDGQTLYLFTVPSELRHGPHYQSVPNT